MSVINKLRKIDVSHNRLFSDVAIDVATVLCKYNYDILSYDISRPWGGFYKLPNTCRIIEEFFGDKCAHDNVDAKVLIITPNSRLSWQYHKLRSETWFFVTDGFYIRSDTNEQAHKKVAHKSKIIDIRPLERHRLVGGSNYTIVVELWQHLGGMSTEEDIVRLDDDFHRE